MVCDGFCVPEATKTTLGKWFVMVFECPNEQKLFSESDAYAAWMRACAARMRAHAAWMRAYAAWMRA